MNKPMSDRRKLLTLHVGLPLANLDEFVTWVTATFGRGAVIVQEGDVMVVYGPKETPHG